MWDILIITNHYTRINIKIQELIAQSKLVNNSRVSRAESIYHIGKINITVKPFGSVSSVICMRGCRVNTIFIEKEWLAEEEVKWTLAAMCRNTIYTIDTLEQILDGELKDMYNYREEMIKNIKNYIIKNNWIEKNYHTGDDYSEMLDRLYDELWDKDEITGNGLNYYDDENKCVTYVMENLPLFFEASREFEAFPMTKMSWEDKHAAQHMDAIIRCYLLRDCLEEACEEL